MQQLPLFDVQPFPFLSSSKKSDEWYTPLPIVELCRMVLGEIDLDPCSDPLRHIEANKHYTKLENGLDKSWVGTVFMNPPFSESGIWMKKLAREYQLGHTKEAIALVLASTDTNWMQPFLKQYPVCFWKGRVAFVDKDYIQRANFNRGNAFIYLGRNAGKFKAVFSSHGAIVHPY